MPEAHKLVQRFLLGWSLRYSQHPEDDGLRHSYQLHIGETDGQCGTGHTRHEALQNLLQQL